MTIENIQENSLKELESSVFQFFLTGSRFFNISCHSSDFDLFVQADSDIHSWLATHGFTEFCEGYESQDIVSIWQKKSVSDVIHIQVVKNAKTKQKIQQMILMCPTLFGVTQALPKRSITCLSRRHIWDALYEIVKHLGIEG